MKNSLLLMSVHSNYSNSLLTIAITLIY